MKKQKYTKEEFEMLGKARHGENAFDYSKVVYINSLTPVKLTCNTCGRTFMQVPSEHLRGKGCSSCSHRRVSWTLESFIEAARKVHGDKYQYHTIENFRGLFYKVLIHCPKHGVFEQLPDAHLRGRGCPHCWDERRKKPVCGVGVNDYEGNIRPNGVLLQSYVTWRFMLSRCYDEKFLAKNPTYVGCSACDEWLHFSNFKKWFDNPTNGYIKGYMLDKDILCAGNRVYSPETCCFVPNRINAIVKGQPSKAGDLPVGVFLLPSGRYQASYGSGKNAYLGAFDSVDEAYDAYCDAKEHNVKEVAEEYYSNGLITEKVYKALIRYKVKQYNKQKV